MLPEKYIPRYTIEDYKQWQGNWELIEGVPFAMAPSPFGKHQKISGRIIQQLLNNLDKCEKANVYLKFDWIVDEETVVRPDVVITCEEIEEYIKSTPKAVFEVVSKSTVIKDEKVKFNLYESEKVEYYILVYPDLKKLGDLNLLITNTTSFLMTKKEF